MKPQIYIVTDLRNGKKVVGQHNGKRKSYYTGSMVINRILKKHGRQNAFKFLKKEIIVEGDFNKELLNELERHYIRIHNTKHPNGYNLTDGGDGNQNFSEYVRKKISIGNKGKIPWNKGKKGVKVGWKPGTPRPKSLGEKVSKTKLAKYASGELVTWNKGRKCTEEEIEKIRYSARNRRKSVGQYDDDWNLIKVWESGNEAARLLGIDRGNLGNCASGRIKHKSGGFHWKYLDDNNG